jgi:hypothetical protein
MVTPRRSVRRSPLLVLGLVPLGACSPVPNGDAAAPESAPTVVAQGEPASRLAVLWTSGDREVALKVAFMYTEAAGSRGWFDEVQLIVWGPSAKLLSADRELQEYVARMQQAGIEVVACRACADAYGVTEVLEGLGIEVKYMGQPLTEVLKGEEWNLLTF